MYEFETFLKDCKSCTQEFVETADIVLELSPLMRRLLEDPSFLKEEHLQSNPDHYARNPVYVCPTGGLSLFTMVWEPGQWTPVHDHGTWGVVGIVEGVLEERNFIRVDNRKREHSGISLKRGGNLMLCKGAVTTFVPNPDHIHRTGVSRSGVKTISLHLYGRNMTNYHVYDLELGRRKAIELEETQLEEVCRDS